MMPGMADMFSQCGLCVRKTVTDDERQVCDAFPSGIPGNILENRSDHRYAYPGDGGIRFSPLPGVDPKTLDSILEGSETEASILEDASFDPIAEALRAASES